LFVTSAHMPLTTHKTTGALQHAASPRFVASPAGATTFIAQFALRPAAAGSDAKHHATA